MATDDVPTQLQENLVTNFIPPYESSVWRKIFLISSDGTLGNALDHRTKSSRDNLLEYGLRSDQWTYLEALSQWLHRGISMQLGLTIWHLRSCTYMDHKGLKRYYDSNETSIGTSIRYLQIIGQLIELPLTRDAIAQSCYEHITNSLTEDGAVKATGGIPDMGTTSRALKALALCNCADTDTAQALDSYILTNHLKVGHKLEHVAWSAVPSGPPVAGATALAIDALLASRLHNHVSDISLVDASISWLISQQNTDGGWSETTTATMDQSNSHLDVTFWVVRAFTNAIKYSKVSDDIDQACKRAKTYAETSFKKLGTQNEKDNERIFAARLGVALHMDSQTFYSPEKGLTGRLSHSLESDMYSNVAVRGLFEVEFRKFLLSGNSNGNAMQHAHESLLPSAQPQFLQVETSFYDYICRKTRSKRTVKLIDHAHRWHVIELILGILLGSFFTLITLSSNVAEVLSSGGGSYLAYGIIAGSTIVLLLDAVVFLRHNIKFGSLRFFSSISIGALISVSSLQALDIELVSLVGISIILLGITIMNLVNISSDQLRVLNQVTEVLERLDRSSTSTNS